MMQADWSEAFTKKRTAGVSDMTLLSKITNDEVNDNLRKRFECVALSGQYDTAPRPVIVGDVK